MNKEPRYVYLVVDLTQPIVEGLKAGFSGQNRANAYITHLHAELEEKGQSPSLSVMKLNLNETIPTK